MSKQFSTASTSTIIPVTTNPSVSGVGISSPTRLSPFSMPFQSQNSIYLQNNQQKEFTTFLKKALLSANPNLLHQIFEYIKELQIHDDTLGDDHLDSLIHKLLHKKSSTTFTSNSNQNLNEDKIISASLLLTDEVENPQKLDLDPTKIERVTFIANFVDFVDNPNGTLVGLIMFCACFVVDLILFFLFFVSNFAYLTNKLTSLILFAVLYCTHKFLIKMSFQNYCCCGWLM